MLWYLVVPPFIVVISFGVLLWLLSRRAGDEEVSRNLSLAQAESASGAHSRSLSRKAFFLKLIEKSASRFKTMTLRIHNFFQHSLERVRRRRSELDAIRKHIEGEEAGEKREESVTDAKPSGEEQKKRFQLPFGRKKHEREKGESRLPDETESSESDQAVTTMEPVKSEPVVPAKPQPKPSVAPSTEETETNTSEPVLRRETATPDERARSRGKDPREVGLLSRIVENPRDITAYEELGDWYFAEGSMEDAKECYRQALKLHPTNRAVRIKIRKLEKFFAEREAGE